MSTEYKAVQWNRQKRIYDLVLVGCVAVYLVAFGAITLVLFPFVTAEILLMRAFGSAAFLLLHVILCIGPICRLDSRFLPLLYNRRHAGVTLFLLAMVHAFLVVATYHAGGDINPILSIFASSPSVPSAAGVPFQIFGFVAFIILFLMAATSHDFWLAQLTAPVWKRLHMMVYLAYALLIIHVSFGALQAEISPLCLMATALGLAAVLSLHLTAARRESVVDRVMPTPHTTEFIEVCGVSDIPDNRARIVCVGGERVAVFKYDGKISVVSNVCQHQNGPLGEGKIISGCITCPWHGYQYLPDSGASPPPFTEKIPTFDVRVEKGRVWINPTPNKPGTKTLPAVIGV